MYATPHIIHIPVLPDKIRLCCEQCSLKKALARKAANTLHNAGEYAEMGSRLVGGRGGDTLRQAGEYMSNMGSSIHNFRRGELANRARQDFGNNSIMNA